MVAPRVRGANCTATVVATATAAATLPAARFARPARWFGSAAEAGAGVVGVGAGMKRSCGLRPAVGRLGSVGSFNVSVVDCNL